MQIKVSENTMIPLGNGKYVRADHVIALDPITGDERGTGSRTRVLIDHAENELIAGRTEHTIIRDMREQVEGAKEQPFEAAPYIDILEEALNGLCSISVPMQGVLTEQGFDIEALKHSIRSILLGNEEEEEHLA